MKYQEFFNNISLFLFDPIAIGFVFTFNAFNYLRQKSILMDLIITHTNGVCQIKLNRPTVFNSFNQAMALDLQRTLDECSTNDEVRAIVITGEGKAFCAGQDLAEATDPDGPELESIVRDHYNPIIERLRNIEKPIIAP